MVDVGVRHREILRLLWREGRLSRWGLHLRTDVNPNAVGMDVAQLLEMGIIRECLAKPSGPGRPRIPLEIDPAVRHMVGLAIGPGRVEAARLSLRGQLLGKPIAKKVDSPAELIPTAQELLGNTLNDSTLAIGMSVTGLVDLRTQQILSSSSLEGKASESLGPLYETTAGRTVVLDNNMHALAARWLLTHQAEANEDVLLVNVGDGQLGAALLIDGRPNRGCIIGANELGHMRFFVETDLCYCGHPGCVERIFSTSFLRRSGVTRGTLMECAARFAADDPSMAAFEQILEYLSAGIANAGNFIRPNRLVLVSEMTRYPDVIDHLQRKIRFRLLRELSTRIRIDVWDQVDSHTAETAAWLALAKLFFDGWVGSTQPA
jgi:N-acetylglucosamine repressor